MELVFDRLKVDEVKNFFSSIGKVWNKEIHLDGVLSDPLFYIKTIDGITYLEKGDIIQYDSVNDSYKVIKP